MLNAHIKIFIEKAKERSLAQPIKKLDLSNAGIYDNDVQDLLSYLKQIKYTPTCLNLDDNNIGDAGLKLLADFKEIEEINLDRNNITNVGLAALETRQNLDLKRLNLNRNNLKSNHPSGNLVELISAYQGIILIEITMGNDASLEELQRIKEIQQQQTVYSVGQQEKLVQGIKRNLFRQ